MDVKALTFHGDGMMNVLHCPVQVGVAAITTAENKQPKQYVAIWDTGASASVITAKVANELGLQPVGMTEVHTAGGRRDCNIYLVDIELPNAIHISNVQVTEADMTTQDVLIGMDIIGLGDLAISNNQGKTALSFRIPSVAKIDFVEEANRQQAKAKVTQPRGGIKQNAKRKQERQARKKGRKKR
jgi:predicted aspartyl protease